MCSCNSIPAYVFMARYLVMDKQNLTFTFYRTPAVVGRVNCRMLRWVECVARMREENGAYRILARKTFG